MRLELCAGRRVPDGGRTVVRQDVEASNHFGPGRTGSQHVGVEQIVHARDRPADQVLPLVAR